MTEIEAAYPPADFAFHHIGYATRSLRQEEPYFNVLGYRREGEAFSDPIQGVAGCFLSGAGPRIELLENLPGSTTLDAWLNAGIKLYHMAYEVANIEAAVSWARQQRGKVTVPPVPAAAFEGRLISFVVLRNGGLIEFIERHPPSTTVSMT
ncbi:MAG TPA: VOC family protein [Rhodocyclaceae bacterium]|nr:VOC family protein [Rhodocyclaceae bacterium]